MRRILLALAIAIAISFAFCISVSALENEELYELDALLEELPKQIEIGRASCRERVSACV